MHYAIFISAPSSSENAQKAYDFCKTALIFGHTLDLVFFYEEAILLFQQETALLKAWQDLQHNYNLPLYACSAGVHRYQLEPEILHTQSIKIAGLGLWVNCAMNADEVVVFNDV